MFPVPRSTEWEQKKLGNTNRGRATEVGKTAVTAPGYIYPKSEEIIYNTGVSLLLLLFILRKFS